MKSNPVIPIAYEISFQDPLKVFSIFSEDDGAVFLDSARIMEVNSRYSFIAVDPFTTLTCKDGLVKINKKLSRNDPFSVLQDLLADYPLETLTGLPPFQGGVAGFFSYDLCNYLERLPVAELDDMQFPDMALGFYDLLLAFDHREKRSWIFSSGYPEKNPEERKRRAQRRFEELANKIKNVKALQDIPPFVCMEKEIISNFQRDSYEKSVQQVIDYIYAGDVFEVNLSQRFSAPLPEGLKAFQLYRRLRQLNPAPFAAYVNMANSVIASASPERFLKVVNGLVETRPIKGTRPRGKTEEEDQRNASNLLSSEKDRAENIMIVDLMRNDLSRVCADGSVKVSQLCGLESYATVHQLVSTISGKMKKKFDSLDLLKVSFPGGSISGAPKVRAMEIIAELEPNKRGPYCGSIGYLGFNGNMDISIAIRTYAIKNNRVTFQAGGAIVADSDPASEYEETLDKAWALRETLLKQVKKS
ncbi:MAG: para-aminobenzoate synthetase component 1 [Chlamydiales bacterium]|jgi:para-aminobenzoate synthetase component 1